MPKLRVIELNQWRDTLLSFELPESDATTAFMEKFQSMKSGLYGGRRWHVYYNMRKLLAPALADAKLTEVIAFLAPYEDNSLAIGIMMEEKANAGGNLSLRE